MNAELGTVASPWTTDAQGYLLAPSGVKAARVDHDGVIWLWDKRERVEVPFTPADLRACITRMEVSRDAD